MSVTLNAHAVRGDGKRLSESNKKYFARKRSRRDAFYLVPSRKNYLSRLPSPPLSLKRRSNQPSGAPRPGPAFSGRREPSLIEGSFYRGRKGLKAVPVHLALSRPLLRSYEPFVE